MFLIRSRKVHTIKRVKVRQKENALLELLSEILRHTSAYFLAFIVLIAYTIYLKMSGQDLHAAEGSFINLKNIVLFIAAVVAGIISLLVAIAKKDREY